MTQPQTVRQLFSPTSAVGIRSGIRPLRVPAYRAWLKTALLTALVIAAPRQVEAGDGVLTQDGRLHLSVNFRFPPGQDLLEEVKRAITGASRLLCDDEGHPVDYHLPVRGEGQVAEEQADVWVTLEPGRATGGAVVVEDQNGVAIDALPGLGNLGSHVLWKSSGLNAAVLTHELGHYVFGLGEQYHEEPRSDSFVGDNC